MKIYSVLLILSITLAFFSGRIAFLLNDQGQINNKEVMYLKSLLQEMQERVNFHYNVDLIESYNGNSYLELISPKTTFHHAPIWILNSSSCIKTLMLQRGSRPLTKTDVWDTYRCKIISKLPNDFFQNPPYLHESGHSYAYLFYKNFRPFLIDQNWHIKNLNLFHIEELKDLSVELPASFKFISELSERERLLLVSGTNYFLTDKYLVINNALLNFTAYPLKMVNQFFKRTDYQLHSPGNDRSCYYQLDQLCIQKAKVNLLLRLTETSYLIFTAAIITLLLTVSSLYHRILKQSLEEERKKHALRVLTHELRTPIASLLLQIENINESDSNLDHKTQDKLLRLESDIYRLKYLAEKSRGYLQSDSDKFITFNEIEIDSLNEFIQTTIDESILAFPNSSINFIATEDLACRFDPYWVQICLRNLIENSIRYGKGTTTINTFLTKKNIEITVADEGKINATNLKSLLKNKTNSGQGMGIGLKIVNKTLEQMDGGLDLSPNPTIFTMRFPYKPIKSKT